LGRRILKEDHTGASVVTWLYTYDGQKVVGEYDDSGASPVLARYYVDGAGYIDEHVLVNQQTGAQAGEYYYLLKELYSVSGLANANGEIVEAYDYDAYGKVRIFTTGLDICDGFGDFDGDCDVDIADFEALQLCYAAGGLPGDCPNSTAALARLDSDSDGDVDDTDLIAFVAAYTGPQGGLFADGDWNSNGALGPVDYNNFVNLCYSGPGGGFNTNGCQVYDFDGDGDVDLDDFGVLWDLLYDDAPSVEITLTAAERSAVNDYFFTGRRLDLVPHGGEDHQRYYYRARTYNTERFMQRDPFTGVMSSHEFGPFGMRFSSYLSLRFPSTQFQDGMNLFQYVRSQPIRLSDPLGRVAGQFPVDTTQACCKYKRTSFVAARVANSTTTKHQRTEPCAPGSPNPKSCCMCPPSSLSRMGLTTAGATTKLVGADWGACCSCTIYYSRATGPWYMHAVISMKCTDGSLLIADHAQSDGIYIFRNKKVSNGVHGRGAGIPPADYPVIVRKIETDCKSGRKMISWIKKQDRIPLPYNWRKDCHYFARHACSAAGGGYGPL
jgi:hypothetical protein